jgi:hypothetical protein
MWRNTVSTLTKRGVLAQRCTGNKRNVNGSKSFGSNVTMIPSIFSKVKFVSKRNLILLRGGMIRKRILNVPKFFQRLLVPKQQMPKKGENFTINFSEVTGHLAFVVAAAAFLEDDILYLRAYSICSIAMSIIFQFYREIPLWIPIRWNYLFIGINAFMISLLLKDVSHEVMTVFLVLL